jgi:type I restriction enzyme S subunit
MKESTVFPILPLGKICILHSGGTPRRSNNKYYGGNIPWAKIADLDTENGIVVDTEEYITVEGLQAINNRIFPKGSILLAMYGSIGKLAIAGRDISCNQAILGIQIKDKEHLDINYLRLWLTSIKATLEFQGRGVTQQNISKSIVEKLEIPLPPLEEQRRIAAILDKADGVRRKRKEAIRLTEELLKSTFLEMFGDSERNFREHCEQDCFLPLEKCIERFIDYRGKTPTKANSGVPLITAKIIKNGRIQPPNEFIARENYDSWMRRGLPQLGDVLFTTEAPLGEVAQVDDPDIALAQRVLLMRGKSNILDNTYLFGTLQSSFVRDQIERRSTGSTVKGIRQKELRKVVIPIPPIVLQRKYASFAVSQQKCTDRQKLLFKESENLFNSLLQKAFRGEL